MIARFLWIFYVKTAIYIMYCQRLELVVNKRYQILKSVYQAWNVHLEASYYNDLKLLLWLLLCWRIVATKYYERSIFHTAFTFLFNIHSLIYFFITEDLVCMLLVRLQKGKCFVCSRNFIISLFFPW